MVSIHFTNQAKLKKILCCRNFVSVPLANCEGCFGPRGRVVLKSRNQNKGHGPGLQVLSEGGQAGNRPWK